MDDVLLLALAAAFNPTLVAASTLMMLLPNPKRLMLGYLLGAMMTSITLGLVIIASFEGSSTVRTTQHTLSPLATLLLGVASLTAAAVLRRRTERGAATRRRAKRDKGPPRWQRALSKGSPRMTFVVGALLTLPGASYLAGLSRIDKLNYPTAATVAVVLAFNVIMLGLLEVPLLCFTIAPAWTVRAIDRTKVWISRRGPRVVVMLLAVLGTCLVVKGAIELLA